LAFVVFAAAAAAAAADADALIAAVDARLSAVLAPLGA
jgi:hypothetical protein